ncbi:hypothetical protein ECDEC1E_4258 [Escherichia coli DEC1E]|nr:hypothetical protein ECDEC1E_4258 [Escherichia coli DEC1E]
MLAAWVNTGVAGEKINLFTIQMIRYHHGKLLAYISRKIAEYF